MKSSRASLAKLKAAVDKLLPKMSLEDSIRAAKYIVSYIE
jgi:hypothetical protein